MLLIFSKRQIKEMIAGMKLNCGRLSPILPPLLPGISPDCLKDHHRGGVWIKLKVLRPRVAVAAMASKSAEDGKVTRPMTRKERPINNKANRRWALQEVNKARMTQKIDWMPSV